MTEFDFDTIIDRRGTHSMKWDDMEAHYGVSPEDGLGMWVADMDFSSPPAVQACLQNMVSHGVFGYYGDPKTYLESICSWMSRRHNWQIEPSDIHTVHGLCNGIALCLDAYSNAGDGVIILTPVYHAFARVINAAGRDLREVDLSLNEGRYDLDFDAMEAALKGNEKIILLCSPHNPGGRIWTVAELQQIADFCERHDLILLSDEIHHDLIIPGKTHTAMPVAVPDIMHRLVMLTATSKTFNLPGGLTGNVIIQDPALRRLFQASQKAMAISGNAFGQQMAEAAYTYGEAWLDALCAYLAENHLLFKEGIESIPGVHVMQADATYLSWVDFRGLGMSKAQLVERIQGRARIAPNHGETFGAAGDGFMRFNMGTQQARISEAIRRLQDAFSDIQ